jgi:hypothetical protein
MDYQSGVPATFCLSKVTLAAGSTTTISNTGTTTFAIKGKAYTKTAMTNVATPTTDYVTSLAFKTIPIPNTAPNLGLGYGCVFTVGFDHNGNVKVTQGTIEALDVNGNFINAPQFGGAGPAGSSTTDNDFCPIGYIVVQLGATAVATWTFGTNNLSGVTGVTYTFVDLITLPDRPQVS